MTSKSASLDQQDSISIITLDDGKANVFSPTMIDAVNECLDMVPTESGSLVIKGRDGIFSGGFDLKVLQSGDNKLIQEMTLGGFKLLSRIFSFPRPVIAACSGHGIALGAFLLCCCDYRVGVKGEFMVGANEMRTNMVIPTPILELIRFRVAQTHKYRAVLGAEMYNLDRAIEVGLIDETIEPEQLDDRVMQKAKELSEMGHPSYTMTKELFIKDTHEAIEDYLSKLDPDTEALKKILNHNIEIRNLSDFNDISLLKKLYDLNQANVPEVGSIKTLSDFIDLLVLSDDILLSYVDNQITGFVVCFYEKSNYSSLNYKYFLENYNNFLYIDRIAVSLSHRRLGIGSTLYQKLIEQYKKTKSIICCEVNIKPINSISLNFHSRFNFQKVGEKDFISHKVRYLVRKDAF